MSPKWLLLALMICGVGHVSAQAQTQAKAQKSEAVTIKERMASVYGPWIRLSNQGLHWRWNRHVISSGIRFKASDFDEEVELWRQGGTVTEIHHSATPRTDTDSIRVAEQHLVVHLFLGSGAHYAVVMPGSGLHIDTPFAFGTFGNDAFFDPVMMLDEPPDALETSGRQYHVLPNGNDEFQQEFQNGNVRTVVFDKQERPSSFLTTTRSGKTLSEGRVLGYRNYRGHSIPSVIRYRTEINPTGCLLTLLSLNEGTTPFRIPAGLEMRDYRGRTTLLDQDLGADASNPPHSPGLVNSKPHIYHWNGIFADPSSSDSVKPADGVRSKLLFFIVLGVSLISCGIVAFKALRRRHKNSVR